MSKPRTDPGLKRTDPALSRTDPAVRRRRMRGDEPTLVAPSTTILYRAVDVTELGEIEATGFKRFPRRDFLDAVRSQQQAEAIAAKGGEHGAGWVTRFIIRTDHFATYRHEGEYRIPGADQAALDEAMLGPIVVVRTSRPPKK